MSLPTEAWQAEPGMFCSRCRLAPVSLPLVVSPCLTMSLRARIRAGRLVARKTCVHGVMDFEPFGGRANWTLFVVESTQSGRNRAWASRGDTVP